MVAQRNDTGFRTGTAAAALGEALRVKFDGSGNVALAGSTDVDEGTVLNAVFAALDLVTIVLRSKQGSFTAVATGAIAKGDPVYAAASGKVASSGTVRVGTALTDTTTNGDFVEVQRIGEATANDASGGTSAAAFTVDNDSTGAKISLDTNSATGDFTNKIVTPNLSGDVTTTLPAASGTLATLTGTETLTNKTMTAPVVNLPKMTRVTEKHTAGDTLLAAESGSRHSNKGAAGTITIILPAATVGLFFDFAVEAAQELRLDPNGTETIALPSTGVQGAAGKYLVADAIGERVRLICETAGEWEVDAYAGTWTAEG